jgi:hypothetical protein
VTYSASQHGRINEKDLAAYLDDHLLGAKAGVRFFDSAVDSLAGTGQADRLRHVRDEVASARRELKILFDRFGFQRSTPKRVSGLVGALAGKLNPLNPLRTDGHAGAQLELETLQSMLRGQECLWRTLQILAEHEPRLDRERLAQLEAQVQRQLATVADIMDQTVKARFLA